MVLGNTFKESYSSVCSPPTILMVRTQYFSVFHCIVRSVFTTGAICIFPEVQLSCLFKLILEACVQRD